MGGSSKNYDSYGRETIGKRTLNEGTTRGRTGRTNKISNAPKPPPPKGSNPEKIKKAQSNTQ